MARNKPPDAEEPEPDGDVVDAGTDSVDGSGSQGQPDAEAFLAQVQERAHKGAAEGTKAGMDEWVKGVVAEADLDAIDADLEGKGKNVGPTGRPAGGPGRPTGDGQQRPAAKPAPSFGQALLELAIGKPRSKPE